MYYTSLKHHGTNTTIRQGLKPEAAGIFLPSTTDWLLNAQKYAEKSEEKLVVYYANKLVGIKATPTSTTVPYLGTTIVVRDNSKSTPGPLILFGEVADVIVQRTDIHDLCDHAHHPLYQLGLNLDQVKSSAQAEHEITKTLANDANPTPTTCIGYVIKIIDIKLLSDITNPNERTQFENMKSNSIGVHLSEDDLKKLGLS